MDKLTSLMNSYEDLHKLPFPVRLKKSKLVENWILDTINFHGIPYKGQNIKNWEECSEKEDKNNKRDAKTLVDGNYLYCQNKFRQPNSGTDIGCALLQPYPGKDEVNNLILRNSKIEADFIARDFKFDGIYYNVLDNSWKKLMMIPYPELMKPAYVKVLKEWLMSDSELHDKNRCFKSEECPGAELRFKRDSGKKSYDSGLKKILCYLPLQLFADKANIVEMIEPPEYLFS